MSRLTFRQQMASKCRHFTGTWQKTHCKAGVAYDDFSGKQLPCIQREGLKRNATCSLLSLPTEAELDDIEIKAEKSTENIHKARAAIVEAIGPERKKQGLRGTIDCPVCGNAQCLSFRYAGNYNGHISARCSTEGCVCWME